MGEVLIDSTSIDFYFTLTDFSELRDSFTICNNSNHSIVFKAFLKKPKDETIIRISSSCAFIERGGEHKLEVSFSRTNRLPSNSRKRGASIKIMYFPVLEEAQLNEKAKDVYLFYNNGTYQPGALKSIPIRAHPADEADRSRQSPANREMPIARGTPLVSEPIPVYGNVISPIAAQFEAPAVENKEPSTLINDEIAVEESTTTVEEEVSEHEEFKEVHKTEYQETIDTLQNEMNTLKNDVGLIFGKLQDIPTIHSTLTTCIEKISKLETESVDHDEEGVFEEQIRLSRSVAELRSQLKRERKRFMWYMVLSSLLFAYLFVQGRK
ncbi:hypothetical protein PCE1_003785 [Barthelona sp. PCE]